MASWWRELWVSLVEHGRRVRSRAWAIVVSGIGGVLGLITLTVPASASKHPRPLVPTWLWLSLLIGGVVVAQFLAFHDVRKERDAARQEMRDRFDQLRYRLKLSGLFATIGPLLDSNGVPGNPVCIFTLEFLNGSPDVIEFDVEQLSIALGTHTANPTDVWGSTSQIVLPGRTANFTYHAIEVPQLPIKDGGLADLIVVYGHPSGGRRFRMRHKFEIGWLRESQTGNTTPRWTDKGPVTHEPA